MKIRDFRTSIVENYPQHQDLSGIATEKLKAYLDKQEKQSVPGEGNQVRRVQAELQRRSQGVAEGSEQRWRVTVGNKSGTLSHTKTFTGTKEQAIKQAVTRFATSKNPVVTAELVKQGVAEGSSTNAEVTKRAKAAAQKAGKTFNTDVEYRLWYAITTQANAATRKADKKQGMAEGSEQRWRVTVGNKSGTLSHTKTFTGTKQQAIKQAVTRFATSKNPVVTAELVKQGVAEGKADYNFDIEDLKRLEQIRDLSTLKAQALALISKPSSKPMKPEKVEWFKSALERMNSPLKVIKLMYDLLLSGEGNAVVGTRSSMNPNSYRQRFSEQGIAEAIEDRTSYQVAKALSDRGIKYDPARESDLIKAIGMVMVKELNMSPREARAVMNDEDFLGDTMGELRHMEQGIAEDYNPEYDDEAGMADNNLETLRRAVDGIDDVINSGDNLPEWCQEKIAVAKSMLVSVWDYMRSEEEIADPEIQEMYEAMDQLAEEMAAKHGVDVDTVWEGFESMDDHVLYETAAWRRKEGKSAKGGLNRKGVASYRRENPGSKLQMAVTTKPSKLKKGSKAAKRRKSFCARMGGVKGPMKKPNGKPTRKALALRKWNC